MHTNRKLKTTAVVLALFCSSLSANALLIESAKRDVDLRSQRVVEITNLVIKNDDKYSASEVTLCLPKHLQEHIAVFTAVQRIKKSAQQELIDETGPWAAPKAGPEGVVCANFALEEPISKGATTEIQIQTVYTRVLHPKPATIKQGEHQRVVYQDTANIISPYKIMEDKTELKLDVTKPESHTAPEPFDIANRGLVLGPYTDIAPMTYSPYQVHFENDFPFMEADSVEREISISHWGNVYFEEKYDISHNGPKVAGEWSRLEVMRNREASRGSASQFIASLPKSSRWLYFRDEIGNISTSAVKFANSGVTAHLIPRFPLFGGWRTKFLFGYSLPLSETVAYDLRTGKYTLQSSVLPTVRDLVVENLEVKIILPEGAWNPEIEVGLENEGAQYKTYTYLDVFGRNVLALRMKNVVPESDHTLIVSYRFSNTSLLVKPLVLSAVFAMLFVAYTTLTATSKGADAKIKTN